jgi:adenylosuccinate synthase
VLREKAAVLAEEARMYVKRASESDAVDLSVTSEVGKASDAGGEDGPLKVEEPTEVVEKYAALGEKLRPMAVDVSRRLNDALTEGKTILFEGAQGTLLDVDFGSYPYVSSSNATAGGACTGTGVGPTRIDEVLGVAKAYTTRVGNGPFPTELPPDASSVLREAGAEYGATTGRPRRCGWFDAVVVRYSVRTNGVSKIFLTKLDVLDGVEELKICTGYKYEGETLEDFPPSLEAMFRVEPVYESLPGWQQSVGGARKKEDLPKEALDYVHRIEELVGAKIVGISVGSGREEMLFLD